MKWLSWYFAIRYSMARRRERLFGGAAPICWSLVILLFPLSWIIAIVVAAFIHEMGHYIAVRCCGRKISKFKIGLTGALLETGDLSAGQEFLCTLAGPLAGLLPMLVMQWVPRVAFCALIQSLFNLLPIYPLDGGRCLRCLARLLSLPEKCCTILGYLVLCALTLLAIYGTIAFRLGIAPLLLIGVLIFKVISGKRPCKQVTNWI